MASNAQLGNTAEQGWVPAACTLPTVERPTRQADFDRLFANHVAAVVRETATCVRLDLRPDAEAASRAAELAVEESRCCSFFSFYLAVGGGTAALRITTGPEHEDVLAALAAQAESTVGGGT